MVAGTLWCTCSRMFFVVPLYRHSGDTARGPYTTEWTAYAWRPIHGNRLADKQFSALPKALGTRPRYGARGPYTTERHRRCFQYRPRPEARSLDVASTALVLKAAEMPSGCVWSTMVVGTLRFHFCGSGRLPWLFASCGCLPRIYSAVGTTTVSFASIGVMHKRSH